MATKSHIDGAKATRITLTKQHKKSSTELASSGRRFAPRSKSSNLLSAPCVRTSAALPHPYSLAGHSQNWSRLRRHRSTHNQGHNKAKNFLSDGLYRPHIR